MYSREYVQTRQTGVNVMGGRVTEFPPLLISASQSPEDSDRCMVGELVTVLPAGGLFPMPLRLHIQVGCNAPDRGYEQATQASFGDLLARVTDAIRTSLDDKGRRIDALVENSSETAQFGQVEVNFQTMELHRAGVRVDLTACEFKTLRYFLSRPNAVISREELLNQVWGYHHYPTTRTVDNRILKLRQKLEPNPSQPIHFLTVHGVGYKFVP